MKIIETQKEYIEKRINFDEKDIELLNTSLGIKLELQMDGYTSEFKREDGMIEKRIYNIIVK